jgi:ribonucleotide reductase alpha subunit
MSATQSSLVLATWTHRAIGKADETCQFGYLNLGRFHAGYGTVPVDLDALARVVTVLVRVLDDAVEASLRLYPHALSAGLITAKRKIGVGVCGLADMLLQIGRYVRASPGDLCRAIRSGSNRKW